MKHHAFFACITIAGVAFADQCMGAENHLCPQKIQLKSATVSEQSAPAPFKAVVSDSPLWLTGASAYDGPPEEGASLKPSKVKTTGKTEQSTWMFQKISERSKWVSCDYAEGLAHLTVQAAQDTTQCHAVRSRNKSPDTLAIAITCQ